MCSIESSALFTAHGQEHCSLQQVLKCLLWFAGDYRRALDYHRCELSLSESVADKLSMGIACRKVGECLCELGDYVEAVNFQKRHLELSRQIGKGFTLAVL